MPALSTVITGQNIHVTAWDESTWGTKPGSPVYKFLPCYEYGVKLQTERRQSRPMLGGFGRKHGSRFKGRPQGPMSGPLLGYHRDAESLAQFVLDWAFGNETSNFPASIGVERAEGPDVANEQANGLRANSATIQGSEDEGFVAWSVDAIGHSVGAVATAQSVPADLDRLSEFEFCDVSMTVDSTAVQISSFNLTRNNNLVAKYLGDKTPQVLARTDRSTLFTFDLPKQADTYDVARRTLATETEYDITLTLEGLHNGSGASGTKTRIVVDMPRCQLINPEDAYSIDGLAMTTVNLECLKPDSASREVAFTYSLV